MAISVLIADANPASRDHLRSILARDRELEVAGDASDGREAVEICRSLGPDVVLMDASILGPNGMSVVEGIQLASPDTAVIAMVDGTDNELMRNLMRWGVRDVLTKPVLPEEAINTIRSVNQAVIKQRAYFGTDSKAPQGKVIAVYSPQGGSGKSMLAANLAVAMAIGLDAKNNPNSIVLVDLNLQFGDVDLLLNLNPDNTIAGLAQKGHSGIDSDLVEQYLTLHDESGLRVLVAPSAPRYAESITAYTVEQVIDALRESFQFVIIDTTSQLQDITLAALDAANIILLLTSLDLLALHKTRTAMEMLRQLYTGDKIQPVLNRANSDVGITPQDVEEVLGMPVQHLIPSDGRNVVKSVNDGVPMVLSIPDAVISKRIQALATHLIGKDSMANASFATERKGGFFGRLFKN